MVTSSLSSNDVCHNIYPLNDKKKHKLDKQKSSVQIIQNKNSGSNNRKKAKENTLKHCDSDTSTKKQKDLNYNNQGDINHTVVDHSHCVKSLSRSKNDSFEQECQICIQNQRNSSKENESNLEEVGKILQEVLQNAPVQEQSKNGFAVAEVSNGGTDTGYSSRCSTPPHSANATELNVEEKKVQIRSTTEAVISPTTVEREDEGFEPRSKSPSTCSDASDGSFHTFRAPNNCHSQSYASNSYPPQHHRNSSNTRPGNFASNAANDSYPRRQNDDRLGFQGRQRIPGSGNFRKGERVPFHQGQPPHHNHYSSHSQGMQNGGNPQFGHLNQAYPHRPDGRGRNWNFNNQRYYHGKNRPYGNLAPNHNHHQMSVAPNGFHKNSNIYYQINCQYDLREIAWGCQRVLSDRAGSFTAPPGNQNGRWVKDHRGEATVMPPELLHDSPWDSLSSQVWDMFTKHQHLDSTFRAKMELKERLSHVIWNVLPMCRLFVVGSSLSGFGANSSDVDMCLMVTPRDLDQRNEAQAVLRLLQRELNNCGFVEKMELITAKVPILKFRDSLTKIDVDLNCNNSVGIRNTHLLNAYSQLDWRVRPLVLVVKLWAQHHNINNAKDMTISSYSLVLMVIHYLQCGLDTPLLPCLHKAYPDKFNSNNHVFKMPVTERMPIFISNNSQTLGELFLGFLHYYAYQFTFIESTLSVRTGRILPTEECRFARSKKNDSRTWKYLCIEEPFDLTNTARSMYDEGVFEKVKKVFKDSHTHLKETKSLDSIFAPTCNAQ